MAASLTERALRRPNRRTLRFSLKACDRGLGPCATPPPRHCSRVWLLSGPQTLQLVCELREGGVLAGNFQCAFPCDVFSQSRSPVIFTVIW